MKTIRAVGWVWVLSVCLFVAVNALSKPRPPFPPVPEDDQNSWHWDSTNWWTHPRTAPSEMHGVSLLESWSGYAVQVAPGGVLRFPAVNAANEINFCLDEGSIRAWVAVEWSNGTGPGAWTPLVESGAWSADASIGWWALYVNPTGTEILFSTQGGGVGRDYLSAPIAWNAGEWHQIALTFSEAGSTALYIDGELAAQGPAICCLPSVESFAASGFTIGGAVFDELTTFSYPLSADEVRFNYNLMARQAAKGPITPEEEAAWQLRIAQKRFGVGDTDGGAMTMSGPPEPPGGGGGGGSGGGTSGGSDPPPPPPGFKLTAPVIVGTLLSTSLKEADTNSAYEIFHNLSLATSKWVRAASGDIGQTNFSVTAPSTNAAFYRAAEIFDTDFDGLSDAYEQWVSGTSKTLPDTDGDGVPDGKDDANQNGVPDYIDYAGLNRVVIWASRPSAFEGALSGELTIRLPTPAPTNNTLIVLHLSRNVDYDGDYYLTKLDGTRVTNDIFFAAGETQQRLLVHAINDTDQAPRPRTLQVKLASSANYQLDWEMAEVALIDNDLPVVGVMARDPIAREPVGTNQNPGAFLITREGTTTNALTVRFNISGTATPGVCYSSINSPVTIPAGSNSVLVGVYPIGDTLYEGDETVILSLLPDAAYRTNSINGRATVTLQDDDLPEVTMSVTDSDARESGLNPGQFVFRRTGATSKPLLVFYAVGGTATNSADYQTLSNAVTIAAGSSNSPAVTVTPIADGLLEQMETVVLSVAGSLEYTIGAANSATVYIDDSNPSAFSSIQVRRGAVRNSSTHGIVDFYRYGTSLGSALLPINAFTSDASNPNRRAVLGQDYGLSGSVSGTNVAFAPNQTKARILVSPLSTAVNFVHATMANLPNWTVNFWGNTNLITLTLPPAEAVEGGTAQLLTIQRGGTSGNLAVNLQFSGSAAPGSDHTQGSHQVLFLPGQSSRTISLSAIADSYHEGWESIVVSLDGTAQSYAPADPLQPMMFVRDNAPANEIQYLPEGDLDNDGLPDRFELAHALDPLEWNDGHLDPDQDGLTDIEEIFYGTNPRARDSDNDTVNDFFEVTNGSNPLDASDGGRALSDAESVAIKLRVGDPSGSRSERYRLDVGSVRFQSPAPGVVGERLFRFRRGTNYTVRLVHTFSTLIPEPDYDYEASILPENPTLPQAFVVNDPQNLLGLHENDGAFVNKTATLIVPKIEVTFTNITGNVALDTNSNAGGGLRVFPDRQHWADATPRNLVRVRVRTVPPLAGQRILLKSFDVDDPVYPNDPSDTFVDTNDVSGARGNDNRGTPQAGQLASTVLTLNAAGEGITNFTVTFQPGDNFRVAAVLNTNNAQAHLDTLQITNATTPFYLAPDSSHTPKFVGGVSPMLTVWRKLHLEFDSMTAPPNSGTDINYATGTITSARTNYPVAGRSQISLAHLNVKGPDFHVFHRGKLEIGGVTYKVIDSAFSAVMGGSGTASTTVEIQGVPPGVLPGAAVKLFDDNDQFLRNDATYPSQLTLQSPPLPVNDRSVEFITNIQHRFSDAYIQLVSANTNDWNTQPTIPFRRHAPIGGFFDFGNQQLKGTDQAQFWAYTVIFAYQPSFYEDGDPNTEVPLDGITQKRNPLLLSFHGYSVIYMESVRETVFGVGRLRPNTILWRDIDFNSQGHTNRLTKDYFNFLFGTIAHEIGHAPGGQLEGTDHAEQRLMQEGGAFIDEAPFSPRTIRRFRNTTSWLP